MPIGLPQVVEEFIEQIKLDHGAHIEIRELLPTGKSEAFVALVDCSGPHDGVYVLKIDALPTNWENEETRHKLALEDGAFSGKLPTIVLTQKTTTHYALLIKLAGDSRIALRPLVSSLGLFRSAYAEFSRIAWTPELFEFGPQSQPSKILSDALGYKLVESEGGRARKHLSEFLSEELTTRPTFVHHGQLLPNPYVFATQSNTPLPMLRPLLGPVHGDCHTQNIFVKTNQDSMVAEIYLIDLATYQSKSVYFFDHAYLEIATILRQMEQLGDRRWFDLVSALSHDEISSALEPQERGWVEDVFAGRKELFGLATRSYEDRMDDLKLQFLLAHVAAGLAFLHKLPHKEASSGGLTDSQYQQSFIWAAIFLRELLDLNYISIDQACPNDGAVPVVGMRTSGDEPVPTDQDWQSVKYFDENGFNILVVPPSDQPSAISSDLLGLPWALIIDFRENAPPQNEVESMVRTFRETWPGEPLLDTKLLVLGGLWYSANGRHDLSGVEPTTTATEWRRTYIRSLNDILLKISETISPTDVRALFLGDGFSSRYVRLVAESLDTAFHSALSPIVIASQHKRYQLLDDIDSFVSRLDAAILALRNAQAARPATADEVLLPCRHGGETKLQSAPENLLSRIGRDLTVWYRGRAQVFTPDRVFGIDFRRGMQIEWAELAQNLDVPRKDAFDRYHKKIEDALRSSSIQTINLLHEPSSGGTTLSRRLAWEFIEKFPVVSLHQVSTDTAAYLRDLFRFCSLPILVLAEASVLTDSEREGLLRQLREDNTRVVFFWVSRAYGDYDKKDVLLGRLDKKEAALFRDAYLEQVKDETRRTALKRLASSSELREQCSPFFFGLTAFGEDYLGVDLLINDVVNSVSGKAERNLLADLALVSRYSNDGFPIDEYDELCIRHNKGKWPVGKNSIFLLCTATHVRVSHTLLAEKTLMALSRNPQRWRSDLSIFSDTLLEHFASLKHAISNRVQNIVQTLFITRDIESALQADTDVQVGGSPTYRRFSPLVIELGSSQLARSILRRIVTRWPKEPHYAAHLARHLLYEEPKEIDEALNIAKTSARMTPHQEDAALTHVVGMAYRVRMEQRLREAINAGHSLATVEPQSLSDFQDSIDNFEKSTDLKPGNEHGLVATIQAVKFLLQLSMEVAGIKILGDFLRNSSQQCYLDGLTRAEDSIDLLRRRPNISHRAERTIAEWNLVYGRIDRVISDLRQLASQHEDASVRRALCSAIIAKSQRNWNSIAQRDLQTISHMMERNINEQGVRDTDVRRWLSAYRHLRRFDIDFAVERLVDWHNLNPEATDPVFYLYILYFLRWLKAKGSEPSNSLAQQVNKWQRLCNANRPLGERSWSYEWLEGSAPIYKTTHFRELGFDPVSIITKHNAPMRDMVNARLARIEGTMRNYRGPQNATLDLGQSITVRLTPLDKLTKDDEGKKVSAFVSFSYDGIIGWDPMLVGAQTSAAKAS